jgi:hypothetical protein
LDNRQQAAELEGAVSTYKEGKEGMNRIGDVGAAIIAKKLTQLRQLYLGSSELTKEEIAWETKVQWLCRTWSRCGFCTFVTDVLILGNNLIGRYGAVTIVVKLPRLK